MRSLKMKSTNIFFFVWTGFSKSIIKYINFSFQKKCLISYILKTTSSVAFLEKSQLLKFKIKIKTD